MKVHKPFAPRRPLREVVVERDVRELALEVKFVLFAVRGVMQHAVGVVEDVFVNDIPFFKNSAGNIALEGNVSGHSYLSVVLLKFL